MRRSEEGEQQRQCLCSLIGQQLDRVSASKRVIADAQHKAGRRSIFSALTTVSTLKTGFGVLAMNRGPWRPNTN